MINPLLILSLFSEPSVPPSITNPPEVVFSVNENTWKCSGCNSAEKKTLDFLQQRGILDT